MGFFESDTCVRVALTLAHSLWQAAAIAIAALTIGAVLRGSAARARYGVHVCALGLMVASAIGTFAWLNRSITSEMIAEQAIIRAPIAPQPEPPAGAAQPDPSLRYSTPEVRPFAGFALCRYAPHCVAVYIAGVIAMIAHLLFALRGGVRLRQKALPVHDTRIAGLLARATQSIGLRAQPAIAYCERVCVPTVVGIVRPMILLPLSLMNGLSAEQVELLLMHELAHLRRRDHWVNLAQRFIESLFFFNPAVWVISRRIRIERELACDDLVLAAGAKSAAYADSLLRIAELNQQAAERITAMALAATGGGADLKRRVLRILGIHSNESVRINRAWPIAACMGIALMACVLSISGAQAKEGDAEKKIDPAKAEMMGRVEDFFLHNYRDVTARKSREWGDVETDAQGNRSIRYMYEATIWDKKKIVSNEVFTFDKDGKFVSVNKVEGYPKEKTAPVKDVNSKQGMQDLVEDFFSKNYRDITARKTIEWGEPVKNADGTHTIRYKFEATIWDKDVMLIDEAFTFDAKGEYVKSEKLAPNQKLGAKPVDLKGKEMGSKESMQQLVENFFKSNYRDISARKTLEWGEPVKEANGNYSIRYKAEATIWGKDKKILNQVFTFDPKGNYVSVKNVK